MRTFWVMAAAVNTLVLLAGCGSDGGATTSSPEEPSASAAETPAHEAVSRLEGAWRTSPVSQRDAEARLQQYDLEKWIKRFRPLAPFEDGSVLILEIDDDSGWNLYGKSRGEPREKIDYDADYDVYGHRVDVIHATGYTTYRWSVDEDTLTLEWLSTTQPPVRGIPDEVFQRALYMTGEFTTQR